MTPERKQFNSWKHGQIERTPYVHHMYSNIKRMYTDLYNTCTQAVHRPVQQYKYLSLRSFIKVFYKYL